MTWYKRNALLFGFTFSIKQKDKENEASSRKQLIRSEGGIQFSLGIKNVPPSTYLTKNAPVIGKWLLKKCTKGLFQKKIS